MKDVILRAEELRKKEKESHLREKNDLCKKSRL